MKNIKKNLTILFMGLFVLLLFAIISCVSPEKKYTETYVPHIVVSVKKHKPTNIHEEMNLRYDMNLDDSTIITLNKPLSVGDTVWYTFIKYDK